MTENYSNCPKNIVVNQLIRSQAKVTIEPNVKHGEPEITCLDYNIKPNHSCEGEQKLYYPPSNKCDKSKSKCSFVLSQLLLVEIPIEMDAKVNVKEGIVCCGTPHIRSLDKKHKTHNYDDTHESLTLFDDEDIH
ncbi:MAG: hypothetical protein GX974_02055 [Clostridiales bacterium]|nr:hypothetical protein [Clostridiales bacterium]